MTDREHLRPPKDATKEEKVEIIWVMPDVAPDDPDYGRVLFTDYDDRHPGGFVSVGGTGNPDKVALTPMVRDQLNKRRIREMSTEEINAHFVEKARVRYDTLRNEAVAYGFGRGEGDRAGVQMPPEPDDKALKAEAKAMRDARETVARPELPPGQPGEKSQR